MTEFPFLGELSLKVTNSGACCHSIAKLLNSLMKDYIFFLKHV